MLWRAFISLFCAVFITISVLETYVLLPRLDASSRADWVATEPFVNRVTDVRPGGWAQQIGLRSGDLIDLRDASRADRWRAGLDRAVAGQATHLTIVRGNHRHAVIVEPKHAMPWSGNVPLNVYVGTAGFWWFLLFAAFVGVRCAGDPRARLLSSLIALLAAGSILQPNNWVTPWADANLAAAVLGDLFGGMANAALIAYTLHFAQPVSLSRRVLSTAAWTVIAVDSLVAVANHFGLWFGIIDFSTQTGQAVSVTCDAAATFAVIAACAVALRAARGDERSRLAWSTVPLFLFFTDIVPEIVGTFVPALWSSGIGLAINNITLFVAPLGLTYALLGRRILDIGFALNRAAVFAATSLILAGVFAVLQWGASTLLAGVLPVHGFASQIAIIVVVYYVVRLSRRSTDAFVTRVFFAARDRRLRALREAITAIDEVQNADALAPFVVDYLGSRAGIAARVFYQDADGAYLPVAGCSPGTLPLGRDSTGVVALRARREPLSLPDFQQLGSTACPMLVRGRLRGIMLCDAPNDGELAPDEIQALATIANRVAGDRDDLLAEELRRENERLRQENRQLRFGAVSPQP